MKFPHEAAVIPSPAQLGEYKPIGAATVQSSHQLASTLATPTQLGGGTRA